jgi:hypothetical protein
MALVYRQILSDIRDGHPDKFGELLLKVRKYELDNGYAPLFPKKLHELAKSVGIEEPVYCVRARSLLLMLDLLEVHRVAGGEHPYVYCTSFEDDGAVQDVLDNALLNRGEIKEIPNENDLTMRKNAINRMGLEFLS